MLININTLNLYIKINEILVLSVRFVMNKIIKNFLILFSCVSICFGCSCNSNNDIVIYKNFYDKDMTTFNYILSNEYQNISTIANMIDGLVENDKYGNIVPSIASSWNEEIIDNKQIWTFHLKNNVYWSDYKGNKHSLVTAHDFVTTIKYSLNYSVSSNNYSLPSNLLENGLNYYNGTLTKHYDYNDVLSKINSLQENDKNNELLFYQNIKDVFDMCNSTNKCTDNFNDVGIKALDDFTLQFTLDNPVPYFLSTLTFYVFLPTSESFIRKIGFNNFGTNKATLLYNGAYLLSNYYHSSRIELVKNENYWDKENVFIDKIILTKSLNYHSDAYTRLSYEAGNINEFSLSKSDEKGWKKYVGDTFNSPIGDNTYVSSSPTNFTAYYLVFNQNRSYNSSNLTNQEIDVANKALKNANFRKSLIHGLNKDLYFNNEQNTKISSIVPKEFITYNSKDYNNYLIETYSNKNNISLNDSIELFEKDVLFDLQKSEYYLTLALNELNLNKEQLPIKIEYTYFYNSEYTNYDKVRIKTWNAALNGCSDVNNCTYDKIEIIYNDDIKSMSDLDNAFYNKEYNITCIGIYPDYNDPTTYLNAFSSTGELKQYLNNEDTGYIDESLNEIKNYYNQSDLNTRYLLCSELEYHIIFELGLIYPLSLKGNTQQIVVSDLVPFTKMKASYGLSPFKFKHRKIRTKTYTQEDIKKLKQEYEEGMKQ